MYYRRKFFLFSVIFGCYLTLSLPFVLAYGLGDVQDNKISFIIEPVLKITEDLEPISCDSSGYITFTAYVENINEFNIKTSKAFVEDVNQGLTYDVSSALTCLPTSDLISNQEITCRLHIKEMLSKIPSCPLERTENKFYLGFTLSYGNKEVHVIDEKGLVIAEPGVEPEIEINFDITDPPYPVPEINCLTGSEIDVPLVIHHSETLFGKIDWSFYVDGTEYGGNLIDCEKILSRENEGRDDIYICTLTIPDVIFPECIEGREVPVTISVNTKDYGILGGFSTLLVSEELDLSLGITGLDTIECQVIDEDGTCIPKDPQKNITATIIGNVPPKLKVLEAKYKLGRENSTTTHCEKITFNRYKCLTFITIDKLTLPQSKTETTKKSRKLTLFLDVKYLNYYTNISDSIDVEMEGVIIDELLNTLNVLNEDRKFMDFIKNATEWIEKAYEWVNLISTCCGMADSIEKQLKDGKYEKILGTFGGMYLWGPAKNWWGAVIGLITQNGPGIVSCIASKGIEDIDKQTENLGKFEDGGITSELQIPTMSEMFSSYIADCTIQNFWDRIKSSWKLLLCLGIRFALDIFAGGLGESFCKLVNNPIVDALREIFNTLVIIISALLLYSTINEGMKNLALSIERINLGVATSNIMTEYADKLAHTMETLAVGLSTNELLINMTYPSYDTIKIIFLSDRTGVLNNGDDICSGDEITIDYNFEKLNQTEDFKSQLLISNSHSKILNFGNLKGTYGPYQTDILLGTTPGLDPSETYTFTLVYQSKALEYNLNYVNQPCQ